MKFLASKILIYKKSILFVFFILTLICAFLSQSVRVNYNLADYLPDDARAIILIDFMKETYEGNTPNVRVYIPDTSLVEALEYKTEIAQIDGGIEVTWLDDSADLTQPLEVLEQELVDSYYKEGGALYSLIIDESRGVQILNEIKELVDEFDDYLNDRLMNTLDCKPILVSQFMECLKNDYQEELKDLGIEFIMTHVGKDVCLNLDLSKICRVFGNIIDNSAK